MRPTEISSSSRLVQPLQVDSWFLIQLKGGECAIAHGENLAAFMGQFFSNRPKTITVKPHARSLPGGNPTDTTNSRGFDELFAEGVTLALDGRLHTNFFGDSGHQLLGGVWTSREFNALGQDPRILFPPLGIPIERKSGSWTLFYNFDQYLVVDPCHPNRGWGLFGRAAISDGNPNPLHWFLSLGIGGTSPFCGRENEPGTELYYKAAVSRWFEVTADLQFVEPAIRIDATTAVVAGLRANIEF